MMKKLLFIILTSVVFSVKGQEYVKSRLSMPNNDVNNAKGEKNAVWINSTIGGTPENNFPNNQNWWSVFSTQFADTRYDAQLAFGLNKQDLWLRYNYNGIWQKWKKVVLMNENGFMGIGVDDPKAQLVVGSTFGASISGSNGGNGVFGSNLAVVQGGEKHNKLITPFLHSNYGYSGIRSAWGTLSFYAESGNTVAGGVVTPEPRMFISANGNIGVGTKTPDAKLAIKGKIHAEEVKVDLVVPAPDYVFKEGYDLKTLEEVEAHIKEKGHLPNIPSAKEMESNGVELGTMNMKLLEKIEELTLYVIQLKEENKELKQAVLKLQNNENNE